MKAFVFDAYGTLFDVFSVTSLCEDLFPGYGKQLSNLWRKKQLEYSWLRSLMSRYRGFWGVTEDALLYSAKSLNLEITASARAQLMDSYLQLATFPDVKPGLEGTQEDLYASCDPLERRTRNAQGGNRECRPHELHRCDIQCRHCEGIQAKLTCL